MEKRLQKVKVMKGWFKKKKKKVNLTSINFSVDTVQKKNT